MPARDRLFVYRPGFVDPALGDARWFCPYSAQVMGFLGYYPALAASLELIELDFPRPRAPLVALLGPDHQAAPMLVLGDAAPRADVAGVVVGEANGHRFVSKTLEILRWLAATRGVPEPH